MNRLKTIKTEEILTGGKTRQKRNGPGGSGCFHAFCYFLARPAEGFARRRLAGAVLVHDSPQTLFLRFPCTKSGCLFGERPARIWCTNPRKTLFLRFPCTKSGSLFGERPADTWCTNPRKTLFLRFLCTKSESLFGARPVSSHKKHPPAKGGCLFSHATRFPGRCLVRQPGGAHRFPSSAPTR